MRVLLVTSQFPPDRSAHAYRWGWLSAGLLDAGHELDVVVPRWSDRVRLPTSLAERTGLRIHPVKSLVKGQHLSQRVTNEGLVLLQSLVAGLRGPRPDVVVATVPALSSLPVAVVIATVRRAPFVLDLRDAWPDLLTVWHEWDSEPGEDPIRRRGVVLDTAVRAFARLIRALQRRASAVITTTDSFAETLRSRGFGDVSVVRNTGGRLDRPLPPPGVTEQPLHVLYMGKVGRAQGLSTAVRAARIAQERGVDLRLRIVGTGAQVEALQDLAREVGANVEWLSPRYEPDKVREQFEWADTLHISLRRWPGMEHTVPSKVYDALDSGRHVSASLEGETARLVTHNRAGDVVPPEDPEALAALWCDLAADRARLRIPDDGRRWAAENVAEPVLVRTWAAVLERAVSRTAFSASSGSEGPDAGGAAP